MEKKSFIIYDNWACLMANLPVEKAGELIQAICNYKLTGEINIMDPSVNAMFVMIKEQLDVDADNYQKTCEKRKESGSKGGKQKIANAKQKVANGSNCKQNVADNDNDTDNDTDNIIKDIENGYSFGTNVIKASVIPPPIEWIEEYCKERNNGIDPQKFFDFYESKGWKVGKEKMKNWQACVRTWENRDKKEQKKNPGFQQTKYDFDAMYKMINGD